MHTGLKHGGDCITCIHWLKSQLSRMFCLNIFFTSLIIWPHKNIYLCNALTPSQHPCLTHSQFTRAWRSKTMKRSPALLEVRKLGYQPVQLVLQVLLEFLRLGPPSRAHLCRSKSDLLLFNFDLFNTPTVHS